MNLDQQKEFLLLYHQYQSTNKNTIKVNLKTHMDAQKLKPVVIAQEMGVALQTIYQLRKFNSSYKPDFITALILCSLLEITITEIMQPIPKINIPKPETKWTLEAKQQFISDYNSLNIETLCQKYDITDRTASEYNRGFMSDLQNSP